MPVMKNNKKGGVPVKQEPPEAKTPSGSKEPSKELAKRSSTAKADLAAQVQEQVCNNPAWQDKIGQGGSSKAASQKLPPPMFGPRSPERLDEDFFQFASNAHHYLKKDQLSRKQYDIAQAWLAKLLAESYIDSKSKKNRNIYLTNLIMQAADGALSPPLLNPPPAGPLPDASTAFKLSLPPDPNRVQTAQDVMLAPKDYLHVSNDCRTYMAVKGLDGDAGACAYIGVSVGGDSPKWIKPSGEETCLPERDDLAVMEVEARGDTAVFKEVETGHSVHSIASRRKPKADRDGLKEFYKSVLSKIEVAKNERTLSSEGPKDPLLAKLVYNVQCEAISNGATEEECGFESLLPALEHKIQCMLTTSLARDNEIEMIAEQANMVDNDPQLVDVSSLTAFDPADDIWMTAVTEDPEPAVIKSLHNKYPSCLVTALLLLLERQRQLILDQEKRNHEVLVASMKTEMMVDLKESVVVYAEAKREHNKAVDALQKGENLIEERKNSVQTTKPDRGAFEKELLIQRQLSDAQRRLNQARKTAVDIENKMAEVNCRIGDIQLRNEDANNMLKNDAARWSNIICQFKMDLKDQANEITKLRALLAEATPTAACVY